MEIPRQIMDDGISIEMTHLQLVAGLLLRQRSGTLLEGSFAYSLGGMASIPCEATSEPAVTRRENKLERLKQMYRKCLFIGVGRGDRHVNFDTVPI